MLLTKLVDIQQESGEVWTVYYSDDLFCNYVGEDCTNLYMIHQGQRFEMDIECCTMAMLRSMKARWTPEKTVRAQVFWDTFADAYMTD